MEVKFVGFLFKVMQKKVQLLYVFGLVCVLSACSHSPPQIGAPAYHVGVAGLEARFREHESDWRATPYLWGGNTQAGVDCSGYVVRAFVDVHNVWLPRTTSAQLLQGVNVPLSRVQAGDLLFFDTSGRLGSRKSLHVGIYLSGNDFSHASESRGVKVSSLDNDYWAKRLIAVKRMM